MKQQESEKLEHLKTQALERMRSAGYPVQEDIDVSVDYSLPYMGYTTEKDGKSVIVVSGDALSTGMALNLLIHELGHVYRLESGHPSHNYELITAITNWVLHGRILLPYQEGTIRTLINHLQDLYADDISFTIFAKNQQQKDLNAFFLNWIHAPRKGFADEALWANAGGLVSAAFAQANLERHHVHDTDGKVAKTIKEFLSKSNERYGAKYDFFKNFMVDLPDDVTDKEFETLLIAYLNEFLKLIKPR